MRLHARWCEAGYAPDAFWQQTPRLIRSALKGYANRLKAQYRLAVTGGWYAGAIGKMAKTPPLSKLLGDKPRRQTREQMLAALLAWKSQTAHLAPRD